MSLFTPFAGLVGGSLIGASAGSLLLLNGDIMGFSGIMSTSLMNPLAALKDPSRHWKLAFLSAFACTTSVIMYGLQSQAVVLDVDHLAETHPDVPIASPLAHVIGGFLVGLGTKLSNGCTSGHGICGLARFSKRSFVAVCTFMGTAVITRAATAPWTPWAASTAILRADKVLETAPNLGWLATAGVTLLALAATFQKADKYEQNKKFGAILSGSLSALGLSVSRMIMAYKVFDFLDVCAFCKIARSTESRFDPSLAAVMGGGVFTSWMSYQYVRGWSSTRPDDQCLKSPVSQAEDNNFKGIPTNTKIDGELVVGAALFGLGWGFAGICPGPALFHMFLGNVDVLFRWVPCFLAGAHVGQSIKNRKSKTA